MRRFRLSSLVGSSRFTGRISSGKRFKTRLNHQVSLALGLALVMGMLSPVNPIHPEPPLTVGQATNASVVTAPGQTTQARVSETYGKLPLSFEANQGQTDPQVKFLFRAHGYSLFLTPTEAVLALNSPQSTPRPQRAIADPISASSATSAVKSSSAAVVRMKLVGANPEPQVAGVEELPGKVNYFIGDDPTKWRTNVSTYAKVKYEDVYPGVDLVYYGNQRQLEYDFVIAPGTDPQSITLSFEGVDKLEVDAQGDLVLHSAGKSVRMHKPVVCQEVDGVRQEISGGYVFKEKGHVGFQVGEYDTGKPLVIDPVLVYSTYLGGSHFDQGWGVAVDAASNTYVSGSTSSANFPTVGPIQARYSGVVDVVVTKINATGSLVYSTYLGGSDYDIGTGLTVDATGNAYVIGDTYSSNFPSTFGAFRLAYGGRVMPSWRR